MAQEIPAQCDIDLPIPDFSVPDYIAARTALAKAIALLGREKVIYVGCMGGFGRTGIFLSLLTRFSASQDVHSGNVNADVVERLNRPIEWVRERYVPNAVETREQYDFVMDFDLRLLRGVARFL